MRRVAVAVLVLVLFGCSAGGDDAQEATAGDAGGEEATAEVVTASASQLPEAEQGRSVIRTATLRLGTDEVEDTAGEALDVVEAAGGFLASSSTDLAGESSATLVYRVPPDAFVDVLDAFAGLGDLEQRDVGSQDVTSQVVDLEGRLAAVRASVERLRGLIADAADVPQIVAIEGELATREAELESLTGQLRALRSQTDLATVTLELREPAAVAISDDVPGFVPGLRTGVVAFVNVANATLTAVGFLLPFAAVLAPLAATLVWRRRRRPVPAT